MHRSPVLPVPLASLTTLLVLGALCLSSEAGADEAPAPPSSVPVETIIIRASPFGLTADQLVQPVDVLSGDELDRGRPGTIGDVLMDRPGISSASFGPGVGRPVIRGQGGPRVQILDNGVASMDASSISPDHAVALDPLHADQVEVIKGPATLIYGGSAFAGVVNVVDDRLPDRVTPGLRLRSDLSYGDNADERNAALKLRYGQGAMQWGAQYARREAGDFDIPGRAVRVYAEDDHSADETPRNVLENSRLSTESYSGSGAWVGERGMLGVSLSRFETDYGIPGHGHDHGHEHDHDHDHGHDDGHDDDAAAHSHDGVRVDMEQTRADLRGLLYDPLPGFQRLELRLGANDYRHREVEPSGRVGTVFDVRELDGRIELAHRPLGSWVGVTGLHLGLRDFEAVGAEAFVPPVDTRSLGLFGVEGRPVGAHRVELGARVERVEHELQQAVGPDRAYTPLSLSAGVHFMLAEHLHLRINAQRAQRAPAPEEVYAFGPHLATLAFERGHDDLKKETAHTLDLSLGQDHGRWDWELGAFYNRVDDYIFLREVDQGLDADGSGSGASDGVADRVDEAGHFDADGELLLLDVAQQDAELYGAEASGRLHLLHTGPWRLSVRAFGDTVRGRLRAGGGNLPRMTPARLGFGTEAAHGPWSASVGYTRVMEQDRFASLETQTPGHDLVSADLGYRLRLGGGARATLYVRGRNLLDDKQRLSTSFLKDVAPQPGRSVFFGLRLDFQPPA